MRISDWSSDVCSSDLALAARLADEIGATPPLVNLGGGMGVPYFPGDAAVDAKAVGDALAATLEARDAALADSRFAMELGRWLVAEAGVYLTRSDERRVGKESVSTGRSRGSP